MRGELDVLPRHCLRPVRGPAAQHPVSAEVELVEGQQGLMQFVEVLARPRQVLEVVGVHVARLPVPAQQQVGRDPAVQLGAAHVVAEPEPVAVLVVQHLGPLTRAASRPPAGRR